MVCPPESCALQISFSTCGTGAGARKTARKQPGFMRFYEGNVSKFKRSKAWHFESGGFWTSCLLVIYFGRFVCIESGELGLIRFDWMGLVVPTITTCRKVSISFQPPFWGGGYSHPSGRKGPDPGQSVSSLLTNGSMFESSLSRKHGNWWGEAEDRHGSPRRIFLACEGVNSLSLNPLQGNFFTMTHSYFNFKGFEIRTHFCVQVNHEE